MDKSSKKEISNGRMKWHFPILDHGEAEGYNDPLLQYFEGDYSRYVAREIIQNSIDARADQEAPVIVRFEKLSVPTADIAGLEELERRIKICHSKAQKENKEKAEHHFKKALEAIRGRTIPILRASDFNTTGLTGGDGDPRGKWYRLVRAVGESEMTGAGGGSFGIGKGAPFAASIMRTVYYSTLNQAGEHIFQGKTRLLSHKWEDEEYRGVGLFGINGFQSVRDPGTVPDKFIRRGQGTDINIIGYNAGESWMAELAKSVLDNFWMAINAGDLEVLILDGDKAISINKPVLRERLEEYSRDEGLIYYLAVIAPERKEEKQLPILGACQLYIKRGEGFPKDIALMRKPKMVVKKMKFRLLQDAYAGVFVCDDDTGNKILRGLEPPEHNDWNENLDKEIGKKAIDELRNWIRDILRQMAAQEGGDPEEIPELDRFLPYDEEAERLADSSRGRTQPSDATALEESPEEIGAEREDVQDEIEDYVRKPALARIAGGTSSGPGPGGGSGGGDRGGMHGGEGGELGISKINTAMIKFRTIFSGIKNGKAEYCLILEPLADQEGAINIVAVGEDSAVYPVQLAYATPWNGGENRQTKGSFICGLKLKKGEHIKIKIGLDSKARYALGIEKYEG